MIKTYSGTQYKLEYNQNTHESSIFNSAGILLATIPVSLTVELVNLVTRTNKEDFDDIIGAFLDYIDGQESI